MWEPGAALVSGVSAIRRSGAGGRIGGGRTDVPGGVPFGEKPGSKFGFCVLGLIGAGGVNLPTGVGGVTALPARFFAGFAGAGAV